MIVVGVAALAQYAAGSQAADSRISVLTGEQVIQILDDTVEWYRALGTQQQAGLTAAGQLGNLAQLQNTEQGTQLTGANDLAALGAQAQGLGETGAGAIYTAGQQQQQQGQTELNTAYQQYLNQVNWPLQMLNVQESALSNSPYNLATAVTLPAGNAAAQGFGGLAGLAGLLGSSGGSGANVFGSA